jgi:hypothetical protein
MTSSNTNGISAGYVYVDLNRLVVVVDGRLSSRANTTTYTYHSASTARFHFVFVRLHASRGLGYDRARTVVQHDGGLATAVHKAYLLKRPDRGDPAVDCVGVTTRGFSTLLKQ